jgi:hypothetical protein
MIDVSMSPVVHHDVGTCAGGGDTASGAAAWLCLAATPTFAIMALWTGLLSGQPDHTLHGHAGCIAVERYGADVRIDECLSFGTLVETDLPPREQGPRVIAHAFIATALTVFLRLRKQKIIVTAVENRPIDVDSR